jgi:transcriptional regulator with XRE-family HTH domain
VTGNDNPLKRPKKPPNPIDTHVGGRLRQRRLELEISPAEMARVLGLAPAQYEECENGTRRLGAALLVRTARLLELPMSWFYEGIDQQLATDVQSAEQPATAAPSGNPEQIREATLLTYFRKLPTEGQKEVVDVARALTGTPSQAGANENGDN